MFRYVAFIFLSHPSTYPSWKYYSSLFKLPPESHVDATQVLINLMENVLLSISKEICNFSQSPVHYMYKHRTINACGGPETRERWRHNAVSSAFIVFGLGARATRGTDLRCDRVRIVSLQTRRRPRTREVSCRIWHERSPLRLIHIRHRGRKQIREVRFLAAGESRKEIN